VTERIGALFAPEVEVLLLEEARSNVSERSGDLKKEKRIRTISARFLEIAVRPPPSFLLFPALSSTDASLSQTQIQGIAPVMVDARHEPSLRFVPSLRLLLALDRAN